MAKVYYDKDADFNLLKGKKIAMLGYGSQGHAHALNLRDSGAKVVIGTRPGGKTWELAAGHGWKPQTVKEAVMGADWVMILLPGYRAGRGLGKGSRPEHQEGRRAQLLARVQYPF